MVCYARPAGRMALVVLVVLLVFGRHVGHFFDTAALAVAITVAAGGAATAAVLAFAAFGSIRRRRAVAGGCVRCQLRCQHAMTEQPAAGPRWPDRPALAARSADQDAERVPRGVGVGSQRLLRVSRAVRQQPGAERDRPLVLDVEVSRGGHRGVQV
jgi:hypothetical protein